MQVKCVPKYIEYKDVGLKGELTMNSNYALSSVHVIQMLTYYSYLERYVEVHSDCVDVREAGCGVFQQSRRYFPNTPYSKNITVGRCYEEGCPSCNSSVGLRPMNIQFHDIITPSNGKVPPAVSHINSNVFLSTSLLILSTLFIEHFQVRDNPSCSCAPVCHRVSRIEEVRVYDTETKEATSQV